MLILAAVAILIVLGAVTRYWERARHQERLRDLRAWEREGAIEFYDYISKHGFEYDKVIMREFELE